MEQNIDPRRMEQLLKMLQAEEANASISQTDGITIRQAEADVPGFYIDQYQQTQDAYNNALLREQQANAFAQQERMQFSPPRADAFDVDVMAMANPNYSVVTEGQRTTVNSNGDIVHY